ncbi:MAG: hypothetical protein R3F49_23720 [Planctomycetota bacterium]
MNSSHDAAEPAHAGLDATRNDLLPVEPAERVVAERVVAECTVAECATAERGHALDRLDRARERLVGWRAALEAAGFRTNLSLMPPCSLAARRMDESDGHWVTVLPTGLVALERCDLGAAAATWARASELDREPTIDEVVRTVRSLFARGISRARHDTTTLGRTSNAPRLGGNTNTARPAGFGGDAGRA